MKTKVMLLIVGLLTILLNCSNGKKDLLVKFKSGGATLLVCPVHILANQESSFDTLSSKKIVEYINDNSYATARITQLCPPPNNEWRANEARMLTISINLFVDYVKGQNLPENTYILYPEFLKSGQNISIKAVHYCLLNNKGEIVIRGLLNSNWKEFQKVNPKTDNDCVDVFINGFEEHMKK